MADVIYTGQVFKVGKEFTFRIPTRINGKIGSTQDNVEVNFVVKTNNVADNGKITISDVSLDIGTYADLKWSMGTVTVGQGYIGNYIFTVVDTDVTSVEIEATIKTDKKIENNVVTYRWEGIDHDSIIELIGEDVVEVPSSAFAINSAPTDEEVEAWADANLTDYQKINGTHLVYNSDPYAETIVWNDINITVDTSTGTTIGGFLINDEPMALSGIQDVTSSAAFDEAAFKTAIEAHLTTLGITAGVLVTDNIDASDEVVIAITPQSGIWSIVVSAGNNNYFPETVTKTSISGRKTPNHIWVANNDEGSMAITKIYQAPTTENNNGVGNVFYIDQVSGNNTTGEIGDPGRPFKSLEYVVGRLANAGSVIYMRRHTNEPGISVYGLNLQGIKLHIDYNLYFSNGTALNFSAHGSDSDTKIIVSGLVYNSSLGSSFVVSEAVDKELVLKDMVAISAFGITDFITSTVAREVQCINVKTNVNTLDANVVEVGEAVFRSPDLQI